MTGLFALAMPMDDPIEIFTERAAIMQFDGGLARADAEYAAAALTLDYCAKHALDVPGDGYLYIMRVNQVTWAKVRKDLGLE